MKDSETVIRDQLDKYIRIAEQAEAADLAYWTEVASGQDTEEAEASGVLVGQVSGLKAARAILNGDYHDADKHLDLFISPEAAAALARAS